MRMARQIAQQGLFTFTNRVLADLRSAIAQTCRGCEFGRIIIPWRFKTEFTNRLRLMNVTASALFPGVAGICQSIRDQLRSVVAPLRVASAV